MWPAVALAARAAGRGRRGASRAPAPAWHRAWPLARRGGAAARRCGSASPSIAHALSAPAVRRERRLPPRRAGGRRCATRCSTGASSTGSSPRRPHWLAPDNFQEDPEPVVAMRTSPTNIGLQLLATVSAYDLGFITARRHDRGGSSAPSGRSSGCGASAATSTTGTTCATCSVLEPAYVSTVDSGNLAGHLIALRQACLATRRRAGLRRADLARARHRACTLAEERLAWPCRRQAGGARAPPLRARRARGWPATPVAARRARRGAATPLGERRGAPWRPPALRARRALAPAGRVDRPGAGAWSERRTAHAARRGSTRRAGRSRLRRARRHARPTPRASSPGSRPWPTARPRVRHGDGLPLPVRRRAGSCSRSATSRPPTRSTARTTICSPPRRGWRASSRSPRTTCRSSTGSGSAAR